jgi:pumilio family protein 6
MSKKEVKKRSAPTGLVDRKRDTKKAVVVAEVSRHGKKAKKVVEPETETESEEEYVDEAEEDNSSEPESEVSEAESDGEPLSESAEEEALEEVDDELDNEEVENEEPADGEEGSVNPKHAWMTPEQREEKKRAQREEQKRLKAERKAAKPGQSLLAQARPLWEVARRLDTPKGERETAIAGLFEMFGGKFKELILKHDGSRVVQTCVKHAGPKGREQIATELRGAFLEVAKNKYGKHLVKKLLLYCPQQRPTITGEFYGHVVKAMRHRDASAVIETIFAEYSNAGQRQRIVQEFYGPEFALFHKEPVALGKIAKETPDKKTGIVKSLEEALNVLLQKGTLGLSLVHRLLLDYLTIADVAAVQAWIPTIAEFLPEIVHTADGAKAVIRIVAWAATKDRKAIVKSFKPFVERIAKDDRGFQTLLAVLALVDDTVLVGKALVGELAAALSPLIADKHGRMVIAYLMTGKNARLIPGATIQLLDEARRLAQTTSKKDDPVRLAELRSYLAPGLTEHLSANISSLLTTSIEMSAFLSEIVASLEPTDQRTIVANALSILDDATLFRAGPAAEFAKKFLKRAGQEASARLLFDRITADLKAILDEGEAAFMLMHMARFEGLKAAIGALRPQLTKAKSPSVKTLLSKLD